MKIAFLSGAYKNSGDFLIEKRAVELIRHVCPDAEISRFLRNSVLDNAEAVNEHDYAVIGGGPVFQRSLKGYMPLAEYADQVKIPTLILGGGWYGDDGSSHAVQTYRFDRPTRAFLDNIYASGFGFSCRDIHTSTVLKNNGYEQVFMTGCPAWYDTRYIGMSDFREHPDRIRSIFVSDPARLWNLKGAVSVLKYLKKKFPGAEITFVFHRGIQSDQYTSSKNAAVLQKYASAIEKMGVRVKDISYGADGFSLYDDCDLHIGYRVHAHIYNLSIRNRSILIEEDGRGAGVNETLGLPSLRAYDDQYNISSRSIRKIKRKSRLDINRQLVPELDTYIDVLRSVDYGYITNAFLLQNRYFESMKKYLLQIEGTNAGDL